MRGCVVFWADNWASVLISVLLSWVVTGPSALTVLRGIKLI